MSEHEQYTVTMLGCGKMGGAILKAWLDNNLVSAVTAIDPNPLNISDQRLTHKTEINGPIDTDFLILAVKPQILNDAAQSLKGNISDKTVIASIAAGKTIQNLEKLFPQGQAIIRIMPNTPAAIGEGANVAVANKVTSQDQKDALTRLLKATGTAHWIDDESLMDAVTALSGSGPAYIFYLIEMLAHSGEMLGLDKTMAMQLARQTVIGSAALAREEKDTPAKTLRENVTSPKGTTEAALKVLMDGRAQEIFDEALSAAKKRGEELSG